jgi:outer membrane protein OmpA-like peptidoglycan-associated protein
MRARYKLIIILAGLLALINFNISKAQANEDRSRYGIFAHFGLNNHSTDFKGSQLPIPCCSPLFTSGDGIGFALGLLFEYPFMENFFGGVRLGYYNLNGELMGNEQRTIYYYPNDTDVLGTFEHTLDTKLSVIGLEPNLSYRIWDNLFISGGANLGIVNLTKSYHNKEVLVNPSSGVNYPNASKTWNDTTAEIANITSLHFSIFGGLSYEILLDKEGEWILAPEVYYYYNLSDIIDYNNIKWKIHSIRFGAALKYSPAAEIVEVSELYGDVNATAINSDGIESPVVTIQVEEFLSTNMKPLLTYIFFDENSDKLHPRYQKLTKEQTATFSEDKLYPLDEMETYYHLLNIIGKRMQQYPDAKIAIDGCNADTGPEKNNLDLSQRRADVVFNYLRDVWGIEPDRMKVGKRNLPQEPSNIREADGVQENRRVEITSNKWEIIAPVIAKDTFRMVTPPKVRFKNTYKSDAGLAQWSLSATQSKGELKSYTGFSDMSPQIDWKIDLNQKEVPRNDEPIRYQLKMVDKSGKTFESAEKSLPVEQITIQKKKRERIQDKYVDRFSLILFQFDESKLSFYNERVAQLMKNVIKPNSEVRITGHTDRMGKDDYNMRLSQERANAVRNSIIDPNVKAFGMGETEQKYDNNLPEGRFYCRRVDVIVLTPVED